MIQISHILDRVFFAAKYVFLTHYKFHLKKSRMQMLLLAVIALELVAVVIKAAPTDYDRGVRLHFF